MFPEEIFTLIKTYHTKGIDELQIIKSIKTIEREKISLISQENPLYPRSLFALKNPPPLLYVKGTLPKEPAITIVGTRSATRYGAELSFTISKELARAHMPVISGLARGIDSAAHRGALEGGITIAVIGSGHAHPYPQENASLAEKICEQGAVISEYPPHFPPTRYSFIHRNRLLAALGVGVILIESPLTGGSMITMKIAEELKRPLFALPAAVDIPSFKGNLSLIKKKRAQLIEGAQDMIEYFNLNTPKKEKKIFYDLTCEEQEVYDALSGHEKNLEELVLLTQLPIMKLNILLTSLTIKGAINEFAGKLYKKNNNTSY